MLWVGFYFLCCPGEYTAASEGSRLFRFCDADIYLGSRRLVDSHTASEADILSKTSAGLTFTFQKKCHPGEVVTQTASGALYACSVGSRSIFTLTMLLPTYLSAVTFCMVSGIL
eukprot:scaffold169570_cov56-Attheya_sp.AAC.1